MSALEALAQELLKLARAENTAQAPAKKSRKAASAPAQAKAASPFIVARAAAREAKLAAGTHKPCPNCGAAMSVERTLPMCKVCTHAKPAERKARHARMLARA